MVDSNEQVVGFADPSAKNKNKSKKRKNPEDSEVKSKKFQKKDSTDKPTSPKVTTNGKFNPKGPKKFQPKGSKGHKNDMPEKIEDWNKFKKEKKELRMKRIKSRTKDNFDRIQEAKKLGEKIRLKTLKENERNKILNQLHGLLKGQYAKFVLAHDTARIVQWLLKYSSKVLLQQISQELVPVTVSMLQSKYGIHCVKRLLKYGEDSTRKNIIDEMKGNAVKLSSNIISASVVEFAFANYASPEQKRLLAQEFYGDLYKNSKDPNLTHLRDVYKNNENMKAATLSACKAKLKKVLAKKLLDSGLVQTVLFQFLDECSTEDRTDLITELASHVVVISNSKDGSKAAMQCIWQGTAKDKKVIMKSLKEHLIDLSKHEFGHRTIISLLDSVDDTVLLHKIIVSEILAKAKDLAVSEYGRKVLLWLVAPDDPLIFHPTFVEELKAGRESGNCKKAAETRRAEILAHSSNTLVDLLTEDVQFWLSTGSLAIEMLAILKSSSGDSLQEALAKIAETITDTEWTITDGDKEVPGIEHAAVHMSLKKLTQSDKLAVEAGKPTFGENLLNHLTDDVLKQWLKINRGCFLLVSLFENSDSTLQKQLAGKLKKHAKLLKAQKTTGAKILAKKL